MSGSESLPSDIEEEALKAISGLLLEKSKSKYEMAYAKYEKWCTEKEIRNLANKKVLLSYFSSLSKVSKPSSLWAYYSMIRTMISVKHNADINDEDWNGDPADSTLYLMHGSHQVSLPRPLRNQENNSENIREKSPDNEQRFSRYAHEDLKFTKQFEQNNRKPTNKNNITKYLEKPISKFSDNKYLQRQKSLIREREIKDEIREKEREKDIVRENFRKSLERELLNKNGNKYLEKSLSNSDRYYEEEKVKNRYNYNERERNGRYADEGKKIEKEKPVQYFEDDGFDENIRSRNNSTDFDKDRPSRSFSYEEEVFFEEQRPYKEYPVAKTRQNVVEKEDTSARSYNGNKENVRMKINPNDPRYYEQKSQRIHRNSRELDRDFERNNKDDFSYDSNRDRYYYEETTNSINRRQPQYRQRSPSPEEVKAPRDRFKDAKEKFLLMEKERLEKERRRPEPLISPTIQKDKIHFVKRHQSMAYTSKDHLRNNYEDRYSNERRDFSDELRPKPAPRHAPEEVRYRSNRDRDGFRNTDKYDPKRRSMFSLIEEEHKKNSNEIAKELKRRSYIDFGHQSFDDDVTDFSREEDSDLRNNRHFHELPEADRYNHPLMNNYSKSSHNLDKMAETKYELKYVKNPQKILKSTPGYRHSYAEPKMKMDPKKTHMAEMLHRTNSTVGYMQPRVGIASVHPY